MRIELGILGCAITLAAGLATLPATAQTRPTPDQCTIRTAEERKWTPQEKWVWKCICRGEIADFDQRDGRGIKSDLYRAGLQDKDLCVEPGGKSWPLAPLDARQPALDPRTGQWPADRVITPEFVETILFRDPYRNAVPNQGVRIRGALFTEPLDLANGKLAGALRLENSRFERDIDMSGLTSHVGVSLAESDIRGQLRASYLSIGSLDLTSALVRQDAFILGSKINGSLIMHGVQMKCDFWADLITVDGHVYMIGGVFDRITRLRYSKIGFNLYLVRSEFFRLDVSGAKIQGELNAGYDAARNSAHWRSLGGDEAVFVLRNASAGALLGWFGGWPALSLEGFTYGHIKIDGLRDRDRHMGDWGKLWLANDRALPMPAPKKDHCGKPYGWEQPHHSFSFQPYRQYAEAIAKAGLTDQANQVLYAGRERERANATGWKYWTMTLASWLVGYGYGYRYFWSLVPAAILVAFGYVLIIVTGENRRQAEAYEEQTHAQERRRYAQLIAEGMGPPGAGNPAPAGPPPTPGVFARIRQIAAARLQPVRPWWQPAAAWLQPLRRWWQSAVAELRRMRLRPNQPPQGNDEAPVHLGLLYSLDMLIPLIQFNRKHHEVELQSRLLRGYFMVHRVFGYILASFIAAGLGGWTK